MIQQKRLAPKSLFCVAEHCIHGDQSVIEATERIVSDSSLRHSVFRRLHAGREAADAEYIKAAEAMPKTTWFRFVLAGVESAQQSFGRSGVGEHEVLEDLQRVPLARRCVRQVFQRGITDGDLGPATHRLKFRRHV